MFQIKELIARGLTRFFGVFTKEERAFVYLVTGKGTIKRFYIDDLVAKYVPEK